jgi:15-cis-phytoene synthase
MSLEPKIRSGRFTNARTTNFYYSFLFLSPEKRRAIEAVYAFARRGDDVADGHLPASEAAAEIARCREDLDRCYGPEGRRAFDEAQRPQMHALAEAIAKFNIPRQPFDDLIAGFEMDLRGARYRTFEELSAYSYRVASTIGLIAVEIFGYRNPATRDYAVKLGQALQLVNILRDLESDGRRGRVYLPQEDLDRFGVPAQSILSGNTNGQFTELMRFEAGRARRLFDEARRGLPAEDRRSMLAAEIMGAIYWRLLRRIERRGYNVFGERVRLSRSVKFWTALSVYLGADWQR